MNKEKPTTTLSDHLTNTMQPWIEYLIENYKDPNKVNSCLDVASDNIRILESLIAEANVYLRDFKTMKQIVISKEEERQQSKHTKQANKQKTSEPEM